MKRKYRIALLMISVLLILASIYNLGRLRGNRATKALAAGTRAVQLAATLKASKPPEFRDYDSLYLQLDGAISMTLADCPQPKRASVR